MVFDYKTFSLTTFSEEIFRGRQQVIRRQSNIFSRNHTGISQL